MKNFALFAALWCGVVSASFVEKDFSVPLSVRGCLGTVSMADLDQRVYSLGPENPTIHVIYSHGFADHRKGNPGLYQTFASDALARTTVPELPFHGDSRGSWAQRLMPLKTVDHFSHLADQTQRVLDALAEEDAALRHVKVIRSGWSTGGLLALYELVHEGHRELAQNYSAAILYAPGLSVKPVLWVTPQSLVDDPSTLIYPPVPRSPLLRPYFAANLVATSLYVQSQQYPITVPTLVVLADDDKDKYVGNARTREWFLDQLDRGAKVWIVNTPYKHGVAFHADVQALSTRFANGIAIGNVSERLGRGPGLYSIRDFDGLTSTP
ncbi:MAG: hypothetical protein H6617_02160 [Bdellovibrionaceae bacterium]|nr:hypothetical protein [Bdellovibrionales bacterium]MCB9253469.1 hypothetical protein [Pseudobdellovibrionaceae bacterium]